MLQRRVSCLLIILAMVSGSAGAETFQARCKIDRTIDMSVSPQKVEQQPESIRARPEFDWVFAYDLELGRLCQVASEGICLMTSDDLTASAAGDIKGTTTAFSSGEIGNLTLSPSRGNWVFQSKLKQTLGKAGDCTVTPADRQQVALLFRDPTQDIDLLCAGRLSTEAQILQSLGRHPTGGETYKAEKLSQAQNTMAIAVSLLDRTGNRGYGRDESLLAAQTESQAYAQRSDAERQRDFAECEAHLQQLSR